MLHTVLMHHSPWRSEPLSWKQSTFVFESSLILSILSVKGCHKRRLREHILHLSSPQYIHSTISRGPRQATCAGSA